MSTTPFFTSLGLVAPYLILGPIIGLLANLGIRGLQRLNRKR